MGNRPTKSHALKSQEGGLNADPKSVGKVSHAAVGPANCLKEEAFHAMLALERRRAERSRKPFVLILLDARALFENGNSYELSEQLKSTLFASSRETDLA